MVSEGKPRRSPCKTFNKKNSLACYKILSNKERQAFDHYELYRIVNPTPGEFYVLPIEALQKQNNRHLSYHKSGAFHWREQSGESIFPLDGESDYRRASLFDQTVKYFSYKLDGYCLALGPRVSMPTLRTMLSILDGYILPVLRFIIDIEDLYEKKHTTILMHDSLQREKATELRAKAEMNGETSIMSRAEMEARIKEEVGDQCKIYTISPQPEEYLICSKDMISTMLDLAREFCSYKLKDKPYAFWKNTLCGSNEKGTI